MNLDFNAIGMATKTRLETLAILWFAFALTVAATEWKTFKSESWHFTVRYPPTWHRFDDKAEVLNIFNFPPSKRLKGVVKPQGGATIIVLPAPKVSRGITTISEWIAFDGEPLSKHEISSLPQESGACKQLVEVETEGEEGPNTYTHETSFYCTTGTGLYKIELSNWRVDPKQKQLQQIALKMALSLRSGKD